MKRITWCIVGVLLVASTAQAQLALFKPHTFQDAVGATGNGTPLAVDTYSTVGLQVVISDTAEVTFEVTSDGTNWASAVCTDSSDTTGALVTSATASAAFQCPIAGYQQFRVRVSSFTGGTVTVTGRVTTAVLGRKGGGGGGVTGWPTVSTTKEITWATSFANAARFGDGTSGLAVYTDATLGPILVCFIAGVENDCNYIRKLAASKKWEITNSSDAAILTLTEATGALTNVTLNGESAGNTITLTEERHFAVASCQNTTAQAVFDLATANTPAPTCDTGTNTQKAYLAFDATTDEGFQDSWILPTGFTGAIDVHFRWKAAATSGAVGWCAQLVRVPDAATSDPAYPAQAAGNCVSDTAKGTTLQENTATISGVTCTDCSAGDHVYVRISRDANGGAVTDDMAGDALLLTYGRTWRVAH